MKKLITCLLLAAMLLAMLTACGDNNVDPSAGEQSQEQSEASVDPMNEWRDAEGNWIPKQPVKDLTGKTFHIIVRGTNYGTYQSDDFTTGEDSSMLYGTLIDDAVKERNRMIEQTYHVTLEVDKSNDMSNAINNDISTQLGIYDAIMPDLATLAKLASEDLLIDLTSVEGFDVHAPWYDRSATDTFSINGHVYFTTGDITILNKVGAPSILFNKGMITTYGLEDPYKLVNEKKWTLDKMVEMGKSVASTAGTDVWTNTYGMLTQFGDLFVLWGASGEKIVVKDDEDLPIVSIGNERSISVAQKLLDEYANGDNWMIFASNPAFANDKGQIDWDKSLTIFSRGNVLFRPSYFSATTKLRKNADVKFIFGILPHPLMDDSQSEYVSYCTSGATAGIAIPNSAKDVDFSAYMIDAYSAYAKTYITHAYYEINLRQKDAYDKESEEMLDIIFGNINYDMGECYRFGEIPSLFTSLASARSTDITSKLQGVQGTLESKVEELRETFTRK